MRRQANGVVMSGVIGSQLDRQDVHEMSRPVGRHVSVDHARQSPLKAFQHCALDVIVLAGEKVNRPGLHQALERRPMRFSPFGTLCQQWQFVHVVEDGCHGFGHLCLCPRLVGVNQATLQLVSRTGHDGPFP